MRNSQQVYTSGLDQSLVGISAVMLVVFYRRIGIHDAPQGQFVKIWRRPRNRNCITESYNQVRNTRSSAIAEGPRDALVSRNSATTKHPIWKLHVESQAYRVALFAWSYTFSRFDTIPECDRHTDRHTTTAYTALSIASRGKNDEQRRLWSRLRTTQTVIYGNYATVASKVIIDSDHAHFQALPRRRYVARLALAAAADAPSRAGTPWRTWRP